MAFRKKLSRGASSRTFKRGGDIKSRNFATAQRGGYRL